LPRGFTDATNGNRRLEHFSPEKTLEFVAALVGTLHAKAGAMSRQQATFVVVEHAADPSEVLRHSQSEINHVLCCGPNESLFDFAERVLCRLRRVREKHFIRRVAYVQAGDSRYSATRQMLCRRIVALLNQGAEFELVTIPSPSIDLLLAVDSLIPVARAGVRVSAMKHSAASAPSMGTERVRASSDSGVHPIAHAAGGRLAKGSAPEAEVAEALPA